MIYNYNCRFGSNAFKVVHKRFLLDDAINYEKKETIGQDKQFHFSNSSSYSTTAGETSSDESFFETRLSRPGLTMEGMVDDSMFDIELEEEKETNNEKFRKNTQHSLDLKG